jgi:hypothetical protein
MCVILPFDRHVGPGPQERVVVTKPDVVGAVSVVVVVVEVSSEELVVVVEEVVVELLLLVFVECAVKGDSVGLFVQD